jgi:hypothetical protein
MLDPLKFLILPFALALGACATSLETPDGSAGVTMFATGIGPQGDDAKGCRARIAAFEAVIANDEKTGNVNESVYRRVEADLRGVHAACAAGRTREADNRLAAVKARYGYH